MITYKTATVEDIGIIRNIAGKTWFSTYKDILSSKQLDYMFDMMYSEKSIYSQIVEQKHVFFIAHSFDIPIGYVSIEQQEENLYHLHKLYVLPDKQGKGIGQELISKAFEFAKTTSKGQYCALELNVNRYNKALNFYIKMGMHISREGDFEIGNGFYMNDYIMRIEL